MYKRILLPLDGSELANQAIRHAVAIALAMDSEIVVLRVIDTALGPMASLALAGDPITGGAAGVILSVEERRAEQQIEANRDLADAQRVLESLGVSNAATEVAEGPAGPTIVTRAEELDCDLVVMSSRGRSGLKRSVLGSVTDHVVRNTPRAAVVVVAPEES